MIYDQTTTCLFQQFAIAGCRIGLSNLAVTAGFLSERQYTVLFGFTFGCSVAPGFYDLLKTRSEMGKSLTDSSDFDLICNSLLVKLHVRYFWVSGLL